MTSYPECNLALYFLALAIFNYFRASGQLTAFISACICLSSSTWLIFSCCSISISRLYCARQRPSWSPLRTSLRMLRFSRSSVIVLFLDIKFPGSTRSTYFRSVCLLFIMPGCLKIRYFYGELKMRRTKIIDKAVGIVSCQVYVFY